MSLKTRPNDASVNDFINALDGLEQRKACRMLRKLMREVTGARPVMWGASIVGFDSYRYTNSTGRVHEWMLTGFSPRKQDLTIYIMNGFADYESILKKLGRHKLSKSCLYIRDLNDIDEKALRQLIQRSVRDMRKRYPG